MRGREIEFKCVYCGKYVPYDHRKIGIDYRQEYILSCSNDPPDYEDIIEMYHKKCKAKNSKKSTQHINMKNERILK